MKLVGPWMSGFTRRVGITLKLLDIPFEHLPFHAYLQKVEVRRFSPMGKVPALVLDDGEILLDSSSIIDYLYETVGAERALLATVGPARRKALRLSGIGDAVYNKLSGVVMESMRPPSLRLDDISEELAAQALTGLHMIEQEAGEDWLVTDKVGHADVMTVVAYQTACFTVADKISASKFPKLDALTRRALQIDAFASTLPSAAF